LDWVADFEGLRFVVFAFFFFGNWVRLVVFFSFDGMINNLHQFFEKEHTPPTLF